MLHEFVLGRKENAQGKRDTVLRPHSHLSWLVALVVLVIAGCWIAFLRPVSLGGPAAYLRISGRSMLPTMNDGDFVLTRKQSSYAVGDVIVYRAAGINIIHRIVGGSAPGGYIVKGDNNDCVDPYKPTGDSIVGREWIRIPAPVGFPAAARQPVFLALVGTGLLALILTL